MMASVEIERPRCEAQVPDQDQALDALRNLGEATRSEDGSTDEMNFITMRTMGAQEHQIGRSTNVSTGTESLRALPEVVNRQTDALASAAAHGTTEVLVQSELPASAEDASTRIDAFAVEVAPRNAETSEGPTASFVPHEGEAELREQAQTSSITRNTPLTDETWTCAACTFVNSGSGVRCEMCLNYRTSPETVSWRTGQRLSSDGDGTQVFVAGQRFKGFCSFVFGAFISIVLSSYVGLGKDLNASGAIAMKLVVGFIGGWIGYRGAIRRHTLHVSSRPLLAPEDVAEQGQSNLQMTMATPAPMSRIRVEELDPVLASRLRRLHYWQSRERARGSAGADTERVMQLEDRLDALLHLVAEHQQRRENAQQTLGAPRGFIASLPTHRITAEQIISMPAEHRMCTICIEDFQEGDEVRMLPCFHRFHKNCVDRWLRRSGNCPICKHRVDGTE